MATNGRFGCRCTRTLPYLYVRGVFDSLLMVGDWLVQARVSILLACPHCGAAQGDGLYTWREVIQEGTLRDIEDRQGLVPHEHVLLVALQSCDDLLELPGFRLYFQLTCQACPLVGDFCYDVPVPDTMPPGTQSGTD